MQALSWNVRGLGKSFKRRSVKKLVLDRKINFLMIQESKLEVVNGITKASLWGSSAGGMESVPSRGASGGLISIWDEEFFEIVEAISGHRWSLMRGNIRSISFSCVFVNVYAPNDVEGKKQLWEELLCLKDRFRDPWCIGGDFNAVRNISERRGCSVRSICMENFENFIEKADLVDLPMSGRRFTWSNPQGNMSRLDRFLVSPEWLSIFCNLSQIGLSKSCSDHIPIQLGVDEKDWGPRPFRALDCWNFHANFLPLVKEKWENTIVNGWAGFKIHRKLRVVRGALAEWNKNSFGNVEGRVRDLQNRVDIFEKLQEQKQLDESELSEKRGCYC